ncbi:MAG: SDR family oxidoreductase [Candidatus Omnitrophica bacterium]|nr:SDR family oxidoreductase [Candidatus Omnitrophota bacterium]MCM8808351.1 SDR family oxidoreductase [Candidatus Omnitrophota bacterium]
MKIIEKIFSLEGKVAIVTGGGGILGSEIAKGLGLAGAKVIIGDIKNYKEVSENLKNLGIESEGEYLDVFDRNLLEEVAKKVINKYGKIDILINAAGGNIKEATTSPELSFFDIPISALEKVVALNLFGGAILPCQVFGRYMVKNENGGSIINISSMNAFRPLTRIPGYSAAKAAVSNFTQWLAVHFALEYNKKLRVNAIAPGFFLTQQNRYLLIDENGNLTERGKSIILHTPMGRFGNPEELVGVCIFLSSDASSFITGTVIPIDGGFNAYSGV